MGDDRSDLIRSRAYELWESEGGPHGRHHDHWEQASREIDEAQAEGASPAGDAPADPVAAPTPVPDQATPTAAPVPRARKAPASATGTGRGRRKKDG